MTDIPVSTPAARHFSLKPLMFESFVCSMAMMAFVALAGPIARVLGLQPWAIGVAMTIAGVAWMVMARVWGVASDRRGRRRILLLGLLGFAVSYLLLTVFIDLALRTAMAPLLAFAGLVIGRGIAGVFYAAVPATGMALVADHIPAEQRTGAMAAIGASSAAGMVVGPGFAGLVGAWNLSVPLYFIAALPTIALIVLWRVLPRDQGRALADNPQPLRLSDARLRTPMIAAFVSMFSVASAQVIVGFYALDRLGLDPSGAARAAGLALAVVGVALVLAQLALRRLGWPPIRLIAIGALVGGVGFASVALATSPIHLWLAYATAAAGMGWLFPAVSGLASSLVGPDEQGAAAGSIAAAQGLGVVLGPLVATGVYSLDTRASYLLTGLMLVLIALWIGRGAFSNDAPARPDAGI